MRAPRSSSAPGKIAVTKLEGKVLGGELVSKLALERAPGGASLAGDVRITDMNLNRPTASAAPTAPPSKDALASLSLEFSGRASTPGALVSVAAGKGELKLGDVTMHAPTPLAVVATSEAVLSGQAGGSGEQLATALRAQIDASAVPVGPRTIPIEIADGAAKLALVTIEFGCRRDQGRDDHRSRFARRRQRLAGRAEGAGRGAGRQAARRRAAERRRRLHRPAGQCLGA